MPNIKSQVKRVEISAKQNARNNAKKTKVKNTVKKFNAAIEAKDVAAAEAAYRIAVGEIDSAKLDGIYHKNTAARKIATLSRLLAALKTETPAVVAEPEKKAKKTVTEEVAAPTEEVKPKRTSRKKAE